jgi:hypothetical protein
MVRSLLKRPGKEDNMVTILAAIDPVEQQFNAGVRAINLAKRIKAKVMFLLLYPTRNGGTVRMVDHPTDTAVDKRLTLLIEEAHADDIPVDYCVASGRFESELVRFVQKNRIYLLVLESLPKRNRALLKSIRHRINCLIEVVSVKSRIAAKKD